MNCRIREEKAITFIDVDVTPSFKVVLSNLGASVFAIYFNNEIMNLVPRNISEFLKEGCYYGKTIGDITGRIDKGELIIGNKIYKYDTNEGNVTLHGGHQGLSTKLFDCNIKDNRVIFTNGIYQIVYEFSDNSFIIHFNAHPVNPTPIALTNHLYFCLGDKNIKNLKMLIPANKYIDIDKKLCPTEEKSIIDCLDFNKEQSIFSKTTNSQALSLVTKGIDHSLIFNKERKITLKNERYQLTIDTDFEAVQLYTDNNPDYIETLISKDKIYRAIAIEPQDNQLKRKVYCSTYSRFIKYTFNKLK